MTQIGTKIAFWVVLLLCITAVALIVSLSVGTANVGFFDVVRAITTPGEVSPEIGTIIRVIRLPRVLMALVAGGGLALAGVVFQAILRNPLADPFILGVSSGAALGTVIGSLLGWAAPLASEGVFAFIGALVTVLIVFRTARIKERLFPNTMLLVGVIINSFFSAAIMCIISMAKGDRIQSIFFWLMGDLSLISIDRVGGVAAVTIIAAITIYVFARPLNLLAFGEESAASLGVDVERTKRILFVVASLVTAAVVSAVGVIGFVGLIIPHMVRMVTGPDHRVLIPVSILTGGCFLVMSDTIARIVISPLELPVGVITALLGSPFFIYLLRREM